MFFFTAAVSLLFFIVWFRFKMRHQYKCTAAIPGLANTLPILGDALEMKKNFESPTEAMKFFKRVSNSGKLLKFWLGPKLYIVVSNPDHIDTLINKTQFAVTKDDIYDYFNIFGQGLLLLPGGEIWQRMRNYANRFVNPKSLSHFQDVFISRADAFCSSCAARTSDKAENISDLAAQCTLGAYFEALSGTEHILDDLTETIDIETFFKGFNRVIEIAYIRMVNPLYYFDRLFRMSKLGIEVTEYQKLLNTPGKMVLERRQQYLKSNGIAIIPENITCFTDLILCMGEENDLNHDQMALLLNDFIVAAYDTCSVGISSIILFLAMHPEYQDKVYNEQCEIFMKSERQPTLSDLDSMNYLGMVYKETARHICPLVIVRKLTGDVNIDEFTLPQGVSLVLQLREMHYSKKYWTHPTEFYPDHFLPEEIEKRPKGVYLPFSGGRRGCAGIRYSTQLVKTVISKLIRNYEIITPMKYDEIIYKHSIMCEVVGGYVVQLKKREK